MECKFCPHAVSWLGLFTRFFYIENVIHVILFLFCLLIIMLIDIAC